MTIKDNQGRTPLDILPSLERVVKERRKLLLSQEKISLIEKSVARINTKTQQGNALTSAFNVDKHHMAVEEAEDDGGMGGFFD